MKIIIIANNCNLERIKMDYKETYLWKISLGNSEYDHCELREKLEQIFYRARKNAEYILKEIRDDFPTLTVHDITHVDSLWQVGSVIVGDNYEVTPLEGFVLGCAFLMHDAVLSYEAAGGKSVLRETSEWKDYYAEYIEDENLTEDERLYEADFSTIRLLHAKSAEKLYTQLFRRLDGSRFYLIEDETIRTHLGPIICEIAASHHWNIDEVEKLGNQIPALAGYPRKWRINPMKLACILRCADAGHIDAGRAPDHILKLLKINGVSKNHWIAQNRLMQIDTDMNDNSRVVIRSNIKFEEKDFAAWNVAFDAVRVLNHELMVSNDILRRNNSQEFMAKRVTGADTQEELCKYIETDGWSPCDANIHISNIEGLINNLGGEKLYGSQHKLEIVLRELIQNCRDAICARRIMESEYEGKITVLIERLSETTWVTVKDDGVGMSINGIKDYLLNFGSSFWGSDLSKSEYPGLKASGYKSVGRFGIGFYSVFMVASEVIIETRKYDKGLDDTFVVKFPQGLCLRPVISKKRSDTLENSTIVRFAIDESKVQWRQKKIIKPGVLGEEQYEVPYSAILSNLTAGLDVDVFYVELAEKPQKIHTNLNSLQLEGSELIEWLKNITYANYHGGTVYAQYIENSEKRLRKVYSDGKYYGIAALNTLWDAGTTNFDVTTIGGLSTFSHYSGNAPFLGCIIGEPDNAKRDGNIKKIDKTEWANEQYAILLNEGLSDMDRLRLPYVLGEYGIDMTEEMVIRAKNKQGRVLVVSLKQLVMYMKEYHQQLIFALSNYSDEYRVENHLDYEHTINRMKENEWLFIAETNSNFLSLKENDQEFPMNMLACLKLVEQKLSISINREIKEKRALSYVGGECKVLVISINE